MDVKRYHSPEDRELEKKRAELSVLEGKLLEQELDLATLRAELRTLQARYLRTVGVLFIELDQLRARLAEAQAARHPQDPVLERAAREARNNASASATAISTVTGPQGERDFAPSDDLKRVYREIAKLVHPDLATDKNERERRTKVMAEANKAYAEGDGDKLRRLLDDWVSSPDLVNGEGVGVDLVRTIRKIHQVERRLMDIEATIAELKSDEMYSLKLLVDEAHAEGRDLLSEMAEEVRREIDSVRMAVTAYDR